MEKKEKFLPIGSVVLLEGGTKKVMITGFCSVSNDNRKKVYDYIGCIYPEGYLSSNQICLFDHSQIREISYIGYESDDEEKFNNTLNSILIDYNNGEKEVSGEIVEEEKKQDDGVVSFKDLNFDYL